MKPAALDKKTVFGLPYNLGIGFLCVLGALVLYAFYSNVLAGPSGVSAPLDAGGNAVAAPPATPLPAEGTSRRPASTQRRTSEEFNPPLRKKGAESPIDTRNVDHRLRLDLLAKVQAVELAGGTRNLFQFGAAPKAAELPKTAETIVKPIGPVRPPDKLEATAAPSAPIPPILLKFYGFSMVVRNGKRTAFFMDGEDPVIAAEGEMVKSRYRVIRILATSVQMEDTEGKRTVTIPITPEAQG